MTWEQSELEREVVLVCCDWKKGGAKVLYGRRRVILPFLCCVKRGNCGIIV